MEARDILLSFLCDAFTEGWVRVRVRVGVRVRVRRRGRVNASGGVVWCGGGQGMLGYLVL
jgi:hypothetical protein